MLRYYAIGYEKSKEKYSEISPKFQPLAFGAGARGIPSVITALTELGRPDLSSCPSLIV